MNKKTKCGIKPWKKFQPKSMSFGIAACSDQAEKSCEPREPALFSVTDGTVQSGGKLAFQGYGKWGKSQINYSALQIKTSKLNLYNTGCIISPISKT